MNDNENENSNENESKALLVLTQEEIDTAIDAIEQAGVRMDSDDFEEQYGDLYLKLHAIENENSDNEYRVE